MPESSREIDLDPRKYIGLSFAILFKNSFGG